MSVQGDDGYPYGVPLNHYYKDGKLYFHGAKIGHRVDAIKKNPKVSFCVYGQDEKRDGDWAWHVKSVIVFGKAHIIESPKETAAAARELCSVFPVPDGYAEDEIAKDAHRTLCFFIEIEHMTGKTVHEA